MTSLGCGGRCVASATAASAAWSIAADACSRPAWPKVRAFLRRPRVSPAGVARVGTVFSGAVEGVTEESTSGVGAVEEEEAEEKEEEET